MESESIPTIRNCRFAFRCPMIWEKLITTEQENIRYCSECDRGVHRCKTDEELAIAIKQNYCVAINVERDEMPEYPRGIVETGIIELFDHD